MYNLITKHDAVSYDSGRGGADIRYIVIHHWGDKGLKAENIVKNWFCNSAPTSAHYVLESGTVYRIVSEADTAWHAGNYWYNQHSIGIECRTECAAGDLSTLAELIADIWKRYGKITVLGHKDIVATDCPGLYYDKIPQIIKMAEAIYSGATGGWQKNSKGWWYQFTDGSYPANCWQKIKNEWYHFDSKGYMQTGWLFLQPHWFYLTDSGAMKTGWLKYNNHWFYFDENGYMQSGWVKYNNYWFYFKDSGIMKTGWVQYKDQWYYCSEKDGKMISDEFRRIKGDWYRFGPDGTMLEKTTLEVGKDGKITV